eukprot:COSAG05_NODE_3330_length_2146_cov_39.440535_3_plen_68_part_00
MDKLTDLLGRGIGAAAGLDDALTGLRTFLGNAVGYALPSFSASFIFMRPQWAVGIVPYCAAVSLKTI